jgi:hypothetical protein
MDESDLWITVVLMHYFAIVEVHCLDQVMCQFGLHQHILDGVDTLDDVHVFNHRRK